MADKFSSLLFAFAQDCERSLQMRDVRVCLVEEFRGQERKIVLVSTVHEDESRPRAAEYVSVMLTRAQEGLYVLGNLQQLARSSSIWSVIQKSLEKHGVVGTELLLRCQVGRLD
jgi:superfamily I DNA and/or RNA helicase